MRINIVKVSAAVVMLVSILGIVFIDWRFLFLLISAMILYFVELNSQNTWKVTK
jgi:hypothetical protein